MNNRTYMQYYNRLLELAISRFKWNNVPDEIDTRYLELTLFGKAGSVFGYDEDMGKFVCLPYASQSRLNLYNIPILRRAYASTGYQKNFSIKNSVIIYNNMLHTNSMLDVEMFAKRLYNLDRIVDVNCNAQKTPILIVCEENERFSMKNLYMNYEGNEPFIFGEKGLNPKSLQVLKTDAPYVADKIYMLKVQIWNEALTYLGISNVNFQKKERMLQDEVQRNQGGVIASRWGFLNARKEACKQINKMFGLDMDVEFRDDYEAYDFTPRILDKQEEGEELSE